VRRPAAVALLLAALVSAGCTPSGVTSRDTGKVVTPAKRVTVPGHLYATKGRRLYRFSGTRLTVLVSDIRVKDLAATPDGSRLAFAAVQAQSSTIMAADRTGQNRQTLTPASAPEGALWAFAPALSADGQRLAYVTDRGKRPSSPQNLQPNDLGVWMLDTATGQSHRIATPAPYTGGDSNPTFRPGTDDQLLYTSYLYGGVPLQPVARLTWLSLRTGVRNFISPDQARNFQPAISPDGRFVAFIHGSPSGDELRVMPLAQTYARDPQPYPTEAAALLQTGMVSQPVWAPDGNAIAFLKLVDGSFDLFILPVSTSGGTVQTTGPALAITQGSFLDADSKMAWTP
jgi:TolB protein